MTENKIEASIKKIKDVLSQNLEIPNFQRPYRWNDRNIRQLLEDVYDSWKSGKQSYRIGSAILYNPQKKDNSLQIVDGQQRITTILLVLRQLDEKKFVGKDLCSKLNYEHEESQQNIFENDKCIKQWILGRISNEKQEFYKYLIDYCEFVEIKVTDLSEAFQMFDSQNGRGKALETYNLLKAYHIRAMETESQDTKIECDKRWENATRYKSNVNDEKEKPQDVLKQVINEQLYRTRKWSRKNDAYIFNNSHISEFKGISIGKQNTVDFAYQNTDLLNYIATKYFESIGLNVKGIKSRFYPSDPDNINPFVLINQNIINGKHFFDYIETYVEIYKRLFITNELTFLKDAIQKYCPRGGTGNEAMFELFKSLIFLVFDKFGEDMVRKYWKELYIIVYRLRLHNSRNVNYNQIAKFPSSLFATIQQAINNYDLTCISDRAKEESKKDFNYLNYWQDNKIKEFYKNEMPDDIDTIEKFKAKYKDNY